MNAYMFVACSGLKSRAGLVSALYSKGLRVSPSAMVDSSSSDIINLISVDAKRIEDLMREI